MPGVDLVQFNYCENKSHCLYLHGMEAEYVGVHCMYATMIYYQPHQRPLTFSSHPSSVIQGWLLVDLRPQCYRMTSESQAFCEFKKYPMRHAETQAVPGMLLHVNAMYRPFHKEMQRCQN